MNEMSERIERIESFIFSAPRESAYLGPLGPRDVQLPNGYVIRSGNRTIYPAFDRSVVVKVTTASGMIGWGETYGLIAPRAVIELIGDVIAPAVHGRDPFDVQVIWEDLYDLMRVRGYHGGFYLDAIAAVDIALWDLCGKLTGQPLCKLLGGRRRDLIPAYASGLPRATVKERAELARAFVDQGFRAIKFAAVVSHDGIETEMAALRAAVGPDVQLMVDLHWKFSSAEAVALIRRLEPYGLAFAEAPCKPEDVAGLADVARRVGVPIAAGEEWRTVFDARPRLESRGVSIVQPEMGHTGVTQFMRIARLAEAHHGKVMPHATIGAGIFMAASLQASAAILELPWHEYQHSIFDRNLQFMTTDMTCSAGAYRLPTGAGLGVEPSERFWKHAVPG